MPTWLQTVNPGLAVAAFLFGMLAQDSVSSVILDRETQVDLVRRVAALEQVCQPGNIPR